VSPPVRLTGAVMAHPRRLDPGRVLLDSAPSGLLDLVLDPHPDGPPTGLRTAMLAWSSIPAGSTHHLVLEDDALLAPGFFAHAERAAAAAPDAAVVFHANWCSRSGAAVRLGALAGARFVRAAREYTPTVALLLPAAVGAGFAEFARAHTGDRDGQGLWAGDVIMARYLAARGVRTYVTVPNLVEHGDFPSVADNDAHGLRLSACYAGLPPDADWPSGGAPEPDALPFFKFGLALGAVRDTATGRWSTIGADRYSSRVGLDPDACLKAYDATASTVDELRHRFGDDILFGVWRTAYATGFAGRQPERFIDVEEQAAAWAVDPLVIEAARSVGPGGLCMNVGAHELLRLREPFGELALAGMLAGLRQVAAPRRGGPGGRVVVASPSLARCLAEELADRGHSATVVTDTSPAMSTLVRVEPVGSGVSVLDVGLPYGPGVDCRPLNDFVSRALVGRPVVVDPGTPPAVYTHLWDLAEAVAGVLRGERRHLLRPRSPVSVTQLARLVAAVIKPVPVEAPARVEPPDRPGWPEPSEPSRIGLADGLRTVGQWLAYEDEDGAGWS
jgi:hypothetical protein